MSTNPWEAGVFFNKDFILDPFLFRDPFTDQRQAILLEIEATKQATLLAFSVATEARVVGRSYAYYYVNTSGTLTSFDDPNDFTNSNNIRWSFAGGSPPPSYYVMLDELGQTKYLLTSFLATPTLSCVSVRPTQYDISTAQYAGPYIELIGEDGISIYRLTVDSGFSVNLTLNRTEPERILPLRIQNGHPFAFHINNTFIANLIELGNVDSQVPTNENGFSGIVEPRIGIIRASLHESDTALLDLDYLCAQDWSNRQVTIRIGQTDRLTTSYFIAIRGKTDSVEWDQNHISISLRDSGILFDRALQLNRYAGTGGMEGDEEITGHLKPLMYGVPLAAEPVLINKTLNIYQLHDGPMRDIQTVSQGGVFLVSQGNFPGTLFDWQPTQADVNAGAYRTDLGQGIFRLAAPPGGRVVCFNCRGDSRVPGDESIADVVEYVIRQRIPEISIDRPSFLRHKAQIVQNQIGIYVDQDVTLRQFFTDLIGATGCLNLSRLGTVSLRTLQRETSEVYLTDADIVEEHIRRTAPPKAAAQHRYGYAKMHVILTESDLLGAYDDFVRGLLNQEYRYVSTGPYESAIANRFPTGGTKTLHSHFVQSISASRALDQFVWREQSLRDIYEITVYGISWTLSVGDNIILEFPRWGLDVPRQGIVVGITEQSPTAGNENLTTLRVWC